MEKRFCVFFAIIIALVSLFACSSGTGATETETDVEHGDLSYIIDVMELSEGDAESVYGLLLDCGMTSGIKYLTKWQDGHGGVYYRVRTATEAFEVRPDGGSFTVTLIQNDAETTEAAEETELPLPTEGEIEVVININSMKFHHPECRSVASMKEENKLTVFVADVDELTELGYSSCANCVSKFSSEEDSSSETE